MDEKKYLNDLYQKLLNQKSIKIDENREWLNEIDKTAGVYIIRIGEEIRYVGETGNIHKRMKDLLQTYNHTFRGSLGKLLYSNEKDYFKASSRKKFSDRIEIELNKYMFERCKVSFLGIGLGRKELEEFIQDKYKDQLLNVRKKRK